MGTLKCEVCGCTDIIKEDGVFVCRGCGMKYSLAEARRILFGDASAAKKEEQPAAAPETADRAPAPAEEEKVLVVARRAKLKEDWAEAGRLYSIMEQIDPKNIEAFFYAAYAKARYTLTDSDLYKRQAAFKVLENSIALIPDNFDIRKEKALAVLLRKISADIIVLDTIPFVYNEKKDGRGKLISSDKLETITLFNNINAAMIKALTGVYEKYGEDKSQTIYLFECRLAHFDHLIKIGRLGDASRKLWLTGRHALHLSWQAIDPNHVVLEDPDKLEPQKEIKKKKKLSGVAIFFIVFGSIISGIGSFALMISFFVWLLG